MRNDFYSRRPDCVAGHVRLELRNVVAKYPFERSLRFPGIQQNSDHRDYSPLSCGVGWTQLGPRTQGITEETATPWGRPESFSIEGARRLRSSGAPPDVASLHLGLHLFLRRRSCAGGKPTTREEKGHAQAAARSIVMACVARDCGDGSAVCRSACGEHRSSSISSIGSAAALLRPP